MIRTPTVLILGAGASQHLGYPLGVQLIDQLCTPKRIYENNSPVDRWESGDLDEFIKRLSRSAHYSIDAFLEENRDQAEIGKFLIARQLKHLEDIDRLFPPNESGWYQYLFNKLECVRKLKKV